MKFQVIMLLVVLLGTLVMIHADDTTKSPDGQDIIDMKFPVRKIGNVNVNPAPVRFVPSDKATYHYTCYLQNCDSRYCYYKCYLTSIRAY
jgi:hypothetical protein